MTLPRVSPPTVFPQVTRAAKPPDEAAGSADAYRQTSFVLGEEVETVLEGLRLEAAVADASSGSKFRNQTTAAILAYWSRSWLHRLQALHSLEWGNYGAASSLLFAASEHAASTAILIRTDAASWRRWMASGGVRMSPEERATVFEDSDLPFDDLVDEHPRIEEMTWVLGSLIGPDFSTTAVLTAADSDSEHTAVTFGDRDFHLGLAEMALGHLLELSSIHLEIASRASVDGKLGPVPENFSGWANGASKLLTRTDRCRGQHRRGIKGTNAIITNWRRRPGDAPRKLLI